MGRWAVRWVGGPLCERARASAGLVAWVLGERQIAKDIPRRRDLWIEDVGACGGMLQKDRMEVMLWVGGNREPDSGPTIWQQGGRDEGYRDGGAHVDAGEGLKMSLIVLRSGGFRQKHWGLCAGMRAGDLAGEAERVSGRVCSALHVSGGQVGAQVRGESRRSRAGGGMGHFGASTFARHESRKPGPGAQGQDLPEVGGDEDPPGGAHGGRKDLGIPGGAGRAGRGSRGSLSGASRDAAVSLVGKPTGDPGRRRGEWTKHLRFWRGRGAVENPRANRPIQPKRGHQIDDQKTCMPKARKGNLCVQGSGGHFLGLDLMTSISAGSCHMRVGFSFSCLVGFWMPGRAEAVGRSWLSS